MVKLLGPLALLALVGFVLKGVFALAVVGAVALLILAGSTWTAFRRARTALR